jgi:hypothetical protein
MRHLVKFEASRDAFSSGERGDSDGNALLRAHSDELYLAMQDRCCIGSAQTAMFQGLDVQMEINRFGII